MHSRWNFLSFTEYPRVIRCRNRIIGKKGYVQAYTARVLFCLLFYAGPMNSQVFFSTNPNYLKSKSVTNTLLNDFVADYPDTSIQQQHHFVSRNFLGNLSLPSPSYELRYGSRPLGFQFYNTPNGDFRFTPASVKYFRSEGPFAQVTGIAGVKEMQLLNFLFTHTLKNRMNLTLKYDKYSSVGFYLRQRSSTANVYFSANRTALSGRSGWYGYFIRNVNKNEENGGIKDVTLNDSTVFISKDLFSVRISNASRDNRDWTVMLNPWIRLNASADSASSPAHYLQFTSSLQSQSYKYKDANFPKDNFYRFYFLDSVTTLDSSHVYQFNNDLRYTFKSKNRRNGFYVSVIHQTNKVWQHLDSLFFNQVAGAGYQYVHASKSDTTAERRTRLTLDASYVLQGANKNNVKAELFADRSSGNNQKQQWFLRALTETRSPDYIYNYWVSNHFKWLNNGFKPQQETQAELGYRYKKRIQISAFYQNIFNLLYFDNNAMPAQLPKTIQNTGVRASVDVFLFKHLGLAFRQVYQNSSRPAYIRLPESISTVQLYYGATAFKNNLQFQIGAQSQWYQSFTAYQYMPATQVFYLQEKATTAACPFVDIYFNARIHPVSFFFKLENLLQGYTGNNYSFVPGYFQPERAFRFGLTWLFFD